jgi:pimeloyl-ACP methyl ester carboxylesterase
VSWNLADYAAGVEHALIDVDIREGWLLAESFSSQILWPLLARRAFRAKGAVLAGGFGKHPARRVLQFSKTVTMGTALAKLARVVFGFARVLKWQHRNEPEMLAGIDEFIARRTEADRKAATHRVRLIAENDPSQLARQVKVPIHAISGLLDFLVPWPLSRLWLRRNCPALQDFRILPRAGHAVLVSAPQASARLILDWMGMNA